MSVDIAKPPDSNLVVNTGNDFLNVKSKLIEEAELAKWKVLSAKQQRLSIQKLVGEDTVEKADYLLQEYQKLYPQKWSQ